MFELRDYQERTVIQALDGHLDDASRFPCVVAPTGAGKTVIGAGICRRFRSSCWVTHRHELIEQAQQTCARMGIIDRVNFHTIQSIRGNMGKSWDLLVLDECHHYSADDWSYVLQRVPHSYRVGLTATPERADGRGLRSAFGRIVVAATYSELLERELLVPCIIKAADRDDGAIVNPLESFHKYSGLKTIAFAPTLPLAEEWTELFNRNGIPSKMIDGKLNKDLRTQYIEQFKAGAIRVLWNLNILTEGFDVPDVECVLLARPFRHPGQFLQAVGRGLRSSPGKIECVVLDCAGNWRVHGTPTEDREYSLDGKAIRRMKVQKLRQCMGCGSVCKAWVGECPECGFKAPARELKIKIRSQALEEVFDGENTPEQHKFDELARLRRVQIEKGHTIRWVVKEYKALFGRNPVIRDATDVEVNDHYTSLIRARKWPSWLCKKMTRDLFGRIP
jgi:DNA repair protein RadD